MEADELKTRLQSRTVQALIMAAIITTLKAAAAIFDIQIDIAGVEFWSQIGFDLLTDGVTLGLIWKAYKGRVTATTQIDTTAPVLPWLKPKE